MGTYVFWATFPPLALLYDFCSSIVDAKLMYVCIILCILKPPKSVTKSYKNAAPAAFFHFRS